jgi:leucyl aminopeptidase
MDIKIITGQITSTESNVIVLSHFETPEGLDGGIAVINQALGGVISQLIKCGDIKGKFKEVTSIYTLGKLPCQRVVILGLGKKSELNTEKIRIAVAELCRMLRAKNTEVINLSADEFGSSGINLELVGQAVTEGIMLGTYTFRKHVTKGPDYKDIQLVNMITTSPDKLDALTKGYQKGKIISEATNFARDMGNEPANVLTPGAMAEIARQIALKNGLEIKIIERDEMQVLGMGGLLGVAQGSQQPPEFIVMKYKGKDTDDLDIALIGKGITFDSGGISIKPSENMGEMKGDMAGGASVIGAIGAIAQLKPRINVTAIVPATENLPGGTAMRPGDIITIMNGKTVEIISTDAEGRLVLADGLCYAVKLGAKRLIDIATLTGACHIALGDFCTGTFGNNQEFINQVLNAGTETGECMWQLPMNEEYKERNKSDVADIKNSGGRYGGAITAAWFLREFIGNVPWVHLDIAGTSTTDKDRGYQVKGNTGVPVRTLINLVLALAEK